LDFSGRLIAPVHLARDRIQSDRRAIALQVFVLLNPKKRL
jgi:hypothetical protein